MMVGHHKTSKESTMPIKVGDVVKVHYVGTLQDGRVFDSSEGRDPLTFTVGSADLIEGFDNAVVGHEIGDVFTVEIPAAQAYGSYDENKLFMAPRSEFPDTFTLRVGMRLSVDLGEMGALQVSVVKFDDDHVVLDSNHPLVEKDLTFKITIVDIVK
jgi:peptidylprolyl isomerase